MLAVHPILRDYYNLIEYPKIVVHYGKNGNNYHEQKVCQEILIVSIDGQSKRKKEVM